MEEDREPYSTLGKIRAVPNLGCVFGNYYSCELLDTAKSYEAALPGSLGYVDFDQARRENPLGKNYQDGRMFVRINKGDELSIRHEVVPSWTKGFTYLKA